MDSNYLRDRTDQILRERIRLGMTGGEEYDSGADYMGGVMVGGYGTKAGARKAVATKRRLGIIGPKRGKSKSGKRKAAPRARTIRGDCNTLKTKYRRKVCRYNYRNPELTYREAMHHYKSEPKYKTHRRVVRKRGVARRTTRGRRLACKKQANPWLFFLCKFREKYGDKPRYQGKGGQARLAKAASVLYQKEKHRITESMYGQGYGGDGYEDENYGGDGFEEEYY